MPYRENSLYVTLEEAVDEIARVYYPTNHYEAADDFTQACKDGKLKALLEANHQEVDGWEWRQGHQSVHSCNLVVRRADLLVIYPDLWKELPPNTANPAKGGYVYNNNTKRIEFRSPVDAESLAAGAVDTGAAVEGPAKPFASTETGAESDTDDATARDDQLQQAAELPEPAQDEDQPPDSEQGQLTQRDKRKAKTKAKYERWYQTAQEIKSGRKDDEPLRPIEIAEMVAKKEKEATGTKVNPETIKRQLDRLDEDDRVDRLRNRAKENRAKKPGKINLPT